MKPLFTVHVGEYLVGEHIERTYPRWNVWVPSKDTGIDLLVTEAQNRKMVSLQVKFSKDFNPTHASPLLQSRNVSMIMRHL
jgi:predicted helicase